MHFSIVFLEFVLGIPWAVKFSTRSQIWSDYANLEQKRVHSFQVKFLKIGHSAYTSDMPYTAADINVGFVRWEAVAFGTAQLKLCQVFITTILAEHLEYDSRNLLNNQTTIQYFPRIEFCFDPMVNVCYDFEYFVFV